MVGETLAAEPTAERPLRIYLAGGVALRGPTGVTIDERALPGRQLRRLFVRLVAARGPVGQDDLADDLWATDWPPAWGVALRSLASKLRAVLSRAGGGTDITHRGGAYALQLPPHAWIDIEAAAEGIHLAEAALAQDRLSEACGWALGARAIASRPLLPGEDAEWLDTLRRRLADVRLRALECLGEAWLRRGDVGLAARDAVEAIEADPFRESAHRLLIRAHLGAGDYAAAVLAFERCRRLLADELGVQPAPETQGLVTPVPGR